MMCEVRVYTQTWYYWATANWLSILFLFTLILLIVCLRDCPGEVMSVVPDP